MDNLSSSDLDSPSKTPLFIGIAAVIVALAALLLGWLGFSRVAELEAQIASLESQLAQDDGVEAAIQANAERIESLSQSVNNFSKSVSDALKNVGSDISKVRSDTRKIAVDAGTALKRVDALEKEGVKVSVAPSAAPAAGAAPASSQTRTADASPGKPGVYTIKSGDTLGKVAAAYKISLSKLQAANPGVDSRRLRIGQQIVIPPPFR